MDYLQDLEKHNVSLAEYPLKKVLDSFPLYGQKHLSKRLVSIEMHPWLVGLQKALEACIFTEVFYQLALSFNICPCSSPDLCYDLVRIVYDNVNMSLICNY